MTTATDYLPNVQRYDPSADEAAVAGIVRHLGIALRSQDASLVSCTDRAELERVRESWLKKKLGRTESDADLDAAVLSVCGAMSADRTKARVTFYYLLAKHYGMLASLH